MNASRATLLAAVVANVLGWWLPVADDYRGWQAFRVALSPLWPFEQFKIEPGVLLVLSVASALTNLLFVVLAAWLVAGRRLAPGWCCGPRPARRCSICIGRSRWARTPTIS